MKNNIQYITSKFFYNKNVKYGFFTRMGGVSKKPYNSLNCSLGTKDKKVDIKKNKLLAINQLNFKEKILIIGNQIHSNKVIIIKKYKKNINLNGDGFITKNKKIILGILTADCAPIFFYDEITKTIAAAHAGWRGCFKNICKSVVDKMNRIGCKTKNIQVIIGPCINSKNYEVDEKFYLKFIKKNKNYNKFFKYNKRKRNYRFDLSKTLKYQLKKLLIKKIVLKDIDTFSNYSKFFSHRRSIKQNNGLTGRMINIIGLIEN